MEFINATRMQAACNMGLNVDGGEFLIVVVKGTFAIPAGGSPVGLADEQLPHVTADVFAGQPGFSAPLREADFAPEKRRCDVSLFGHAWAPADKQVTEMQVGFRVGPLSKRIRVVGDRVWQPGLGATTASSPDPFVRMPLSYDFAFGGTDRRHDDPAQHGALSANPIGRGWHKHLRREWLFESPLPNLEALDDPIRSPTGNHRPASLGIVGRNWSPRAAYAGTYDEEWLAERFPFLPVDFDSRYYQSVSEDQQMDLRDTALDVELAGCFPDGPRRFSIPHFEAPIHVFPRRGRREDLVARLDTIVFEPDDSRFTLCWRASRPITKSMHEIASVVVGRKGAAWWQQRSTASFPIPIVAAPMPTAATAL